MDDLARGPAGDRDAVFRRAASDHSLLAQLVEKDFWVCWTLRRLFEPPLVEGMVFKGGTSLSKVWNAISRFSEDIDLTIPRSTLSVDDPAEAHSRTKRKDAVKEVQALVIDWCAGPGLGLLRQAFRAVLGDTGWRLTAKGDSIIFDYPTGLIADRPASTYVQSNVRLELGALMPVAPWENHEVRPYAASAGSYRMAESVARVRVLAGERTFWEKVTLVHALNSGPADKIGDRKSRHYSDLAMLIEHDIGTRAMERIDLLPIVAAEKESYYPAKAANYPAAARGRLKLAPPDEHLALIRSDYQAMAEMFHGPEPLALNEIVARLADLERRVAERLSGAGA